MRLVLATSNKGKLKEIQEYCNELEVIPYNELIEEFEIVEDGSTFAQNAVIKAQAVYDALGDDSIVVLSDDSGISIDALGGEPGIYSARYAGEDANDKENLNKAVKELKSRGFEYSTAHYTAAMAIVSKYGVQTVHGWMYGKVITSPKGENGFGYDPMFVPYGFDKTIAELQSDVKKSLSHRSKALQNAQVVLRSIKL